MLSIALAYFKDRGMARLVKTGAVLIGLAIVDQWLAGRWPATYGLYHPLAAIVVMNSALLPLYLFRSQ
ncbi:hypothetical protein WI40_14735 [Burkholderia ubonensis]|uniref:hypothetical protein n=1 Tax=Burkholderia ubonensis TaxID=101571 RepID=UPI0007533128|nr:hypothetical protein [Burkholderia ubonensis]KUZ97530.1 hypothetical protein WI40_14735 [Burkholderia ubonensis]